MTDAYLDQHNEWALAERIAELEAKVAALTEERDYWRMIVEDPGLYWGDDNPPYRLPGYGDGDDGE